MSSHTIRLLGGGMAHWGVPIAKGDGLRTFTYQAFLMLRFLFTDGRMVHMPACIAGMDDINARGEVPAGHGYIEMHDDDDDLLHARVEWIVENGVDRGSLSFHGGSGKWRGATGRIVVDLWGAPARAGTPMPPPGPIEFCGFIEGEGQLELPHFPA